MKFDPIRKRKVAEEFELGWVLNTKFDDDMPMGNLMASHLDSVVSLILVGHGEAVALVLPTFIAWLNGAITRKEDLGESFDFHHRNLNWALGMYLWIAESRTPADVWEQARLHDLVAVEDGAFARKDLGAGRLDDYMAFCLQAGRYLEGIAEFEKYARTLNFSAQGSLQPRQYAYLLCQARIKGCVNAPDLQGAGHRMLRAHLEEWLSYGQYSRAATWLKIVNWDNATKTTPVETIQRAYEDMPTIARPAFV